MLPVAQAPHKPWKVPKNHMEPDQNSMFRSQKPLRSHGFHVLLAHAHAQNGLPHPERYATRRPCTVRTPKPPKKWIFLTRTACFPAKKGPQRPFEAAKPC